MRYPKAEWRPLASGHQPSMSGHRAVILHTQVGNLTSTDRMFHENGWTGTESHNGVGGPWGDDKDGVAYQWADADYRADANLEGNGTCISIETGDNAPKFVRDIKAWTPKMLDKIVDMVAWYCSVEAHEDCPSSWRCHKEGIPAVLMTDSKPSSRGIGYHQLGCEHADGVGSHPGFLVAGGERWSTSLGKECPGPERIAQVKTIIVPRVAAKLKGEPDVAALTMDDLMKMEFVLTTQTQVNAINLNGGDYKVGDAVSLRTIALWGGPGDQRLLSELRGVAAEIPNDLAARLTSIDKQIPDDLAAQLAGLTTALKAVPSDLATRLQVIQDGVQSLQPPTPTGPSRSV